MITIRHPMHALASGYLAVSIVGAVHAVRRGLTAQFAGVRLPGTTRSQVWTIGTALSAPPAMLMALVVAVRLRHRRALRLLSWLFLVGVIGEPDTLTAVREPLADPLTTGCTALAVALPIAMLVELR